MDTPRSRAWRRHHRARLAAVRRNYWTVRPYWWTTDSDEPTPKQVRHRACAMATPKRCSCWMCGNPRRRMQELTLAEQRQNESDRADWLALDAWGCPLDQDLESLEQHADAPREHESRRTQGA